MTESSPTLVALIIHKIIIHKDVSILPGDETNEVHDNTDRWPGRQELLEHAQTKPVTTAPDDGDDEVGEVKDVRGFTILLAEELPENVEVEDWEEREDDEAPVEPLMIIWIQNIVKTEVGVIFQEHCLSQPSVLN